MPGRLWLIIQLNINLLTKRLIRFVRFIYGHLMAHYRIRHMAPVRVFPAIVFTPLEPLDPPAGAPHNWIRHSFPFGAPRNLQAINRGLLEMQIFGTARSLLKLFELVYHRQGIKVAAKCFLFSRQQLLQLLLPN